ncbi:MAG: SH3 domain-containing protein [Lachnospiraceae bacterium]|nr:SH3 domain-containing protein [Lachnospiraceae bacterium]
MKKANGLYNRLRGILGVFALVAILTAGLFADAFTIISLADSAGKITANTAKVRKEASTSSDTLASVKKGDTVTIKGQTKDSDGYTWYQVVYDGTKTGYIRSDLMEITDGSTPGTIVASTTGQTTGNATTTTGQDETVVDVTEVQPVSAKVSGSSPVRVRQNASMTSRIVSTAQGGLALTVTGTATGDDGNQWYRVSFIANGSEVSGFIRADYVTLNGDLVPAGTATEEPQQPAEQPAENQGTGVDGSKDWDTYYQDEIWHLVDNTTGKSYSISQIFETVETNNNTLKEVLATNQTQQIAVVALVILAVILVLIISVLIFKMKEMKDAAYYEKVERETVRKRAADRPAQTGAKTAGGNGQRPQQTKKPSGSNGNGQRPAGAGEKRPNGQRPNGQHQSGQHQSGKRPAGAGERRPNGQRPNGADSHDHRPNNAAKKVRPAEVNPEEKDLEVQQDVRDTLQENIQKPVSEKVQETVKETVSEEKSEKMLDPSESFTENIEEAAREIAREMGDPVPPRTEEKKKWKSKNFADDDEFEFQFLDWDEDQE